MERLQSPSEWALTRSKPTLSSPVVHHALGAGLGGNQVRNPVGDLSASRLAGPLGAEQAGRSFLAGSKSTSFKPYNKNLKATAAVSDSQVAMMLGAPLSEELSPLQGFGAEPPNKNEAAP